MSVYLSNAGECKGKKSEIAIVTRQSNRTKEGLTGQANRQDKDKDKQQQTNNCLVLDCGKVSEGGQ